MEPPPPGFFINPPARALDRLIQIADAPLPTANAPPNDPDRLIQRPNPPSLKDSTAFPQWKKSFQDLANDGPGFTLLLENLDEWLTTVQAHASPSSRKKRQAMEYRWEIYVGIMEQGISGERTWHSDVILKYGPKFLPVLNHLARGTKGRKSIKASTLQEYMMLFSWCIARNSRDPETSCVDGIQLLTKKGMLSMLNDQLYHLIRTSNLDRHQDEKVYFGRYEIKLMIEVALRKSATSGRMIAIRSICILLTCFYTSLRPGSLGFSFDEYLRDGKFPILADVQVFRVSEMAFKVKLTIKNFKGFNSTVQGQAREYWLTPIQNWENVTFDVAFWYVLYLFLRGALDGINTMDDLRNYSDYSLRIKDEKKHEPLFLAANSGGRAFQDPPHPMSARSVSALCSILSRDAGMPKSGLYSIRRETGNRYEVLIGKSRAAMIMGHARPGSLKYYSHNTGNIDLVGVTMNALPRGHDVNALHADMLNKDSTPAIQAVLSLVDIVDEDEEDDDEENDNTNKKERVEFVIKKPTLSHEDKLGLHEADVEMNKLAKEEVTAWDAWLACYTPRDDGVPFGRALSAMNRYLAADGVRPIADEETITKALNHLKKAVSEAGKRRRRINRLGQSALNSKEDKRRLAAIKGTAQDLKRAAEQLAKPSHFLTTSLGTGILESMVAGPSIQPLIPPVPRPSTVPAPTSSILLAPTPSILPAPRPSIPPTPRPSSPPPPSGPSLGLLNKGSLLPGPSPAPPLTSLLPNPSPIPSPGISGPEGSSEFLEHVAANMQLDQDEEDSEEEEEGVDTEIQNMFDQALQLTSAEYKPDDPQPLVDESEPPTSIADVEKPPPADAEFTAAEIRSLLMEVVLQPVFLDRALLAMSQDDDGKWRCPRCKELYGHDPESQEHDHGSRTHLERHIYTKHSDWKDLVLQMLTANSDVFKCPTHGCDFKAETEALVRTHCLEECSASELYGTLAKSHTKKYRARRGIKSHQITSTQITQRATRRVEGYTQLLMEVRSIFNDVEDESHRARLHANVDSLIGQADTFSTSDKHIPVTVSELLELVEELSDLSEDSE